MKNHPILDGTSSENTSTTMLPESGDSTSAETLLSFGFLYSNDHRRCRCYFFFGTGISRNSNSESGIRPG